MIGLSRNRRSQSPKYAICKNVVAATKEPPKQHKKQEGYSDVSDLTEKILLLLSFIQTNGAITGVVGFFGGWYIGNKIAVLADRRKEYNLIADKIRANLRSDIEMIKRSALPSFAISDNDFTTLIDCYYTSTFETIFCGISKSGLIKAKVKYQENQGIKYTDYNPITGTGTLVIQPDFKTLSFVATNLFKQVPHK